eukprot:3093976-Prymnesium_polylepis.2
MLARCDVSEPHTRRAARGAPWSLGGKTCTNAQYELSTACRAEGGEPRPHTIIATHRRLTTTPTASESRRIEKLARARQNEVGHSETRRGAGAEMVCTPLEGGGSADVRTTAPVGVSQ